MRQARRPWRHRRGAWVAVSAAAVIVVSVGFDVGHTTTPHDRASDLRGYVTSLNTDIAACNSSVRDSWSAYYAVTHGQPGERAAALTIIEGDEPNCTPEANSDLYDMDTTEAPATLRSFGVQSAALDLDTWSFPQAASAIDDLATLLRRPDVADAEAARRDLHTRAGAMQQLGQSAQGVLDRAAGALGTSVARLDLGAAGDLGAVGL